MAQGNVARRYTTCSHAVCLCTHSTPSNWKPGTHLLFPGAELLQLSEGLPGMFAGKLRDMGVQSMKHNQAFGLLPTDTYILEGKDLGKV